MATNIDERIVAAKFDASDFEKGVDKTLKKLDELKKSLNLKEATKGVEELAEKTKDSTDSMSKSLDKLTERFTTFVGMIKQKILSGLADEVANVFLKMEQSVKNFIRSISSDQVNAGMSKYEQMLTSVRVMMSAGKDEEESYKAIQRLQTYADETSYSLSQMTDAMSKMVAAGVELPDATKNVEGIANACANAGINAQDASRAFYNLSQAYSSGTLQYTDYRSLELLNLTTEEFKKSMLESAEAAGTLKKIGDGIWQTINKNDKKVTAGKKVTEKNLRDMLKYNFMNTAAMNNLFGGTYWMEVIGREELENTKKEFQRLYGDNWEAELKKKYGEIAVTAYEAAKEARNFTDVINALKDAVSTGWATTFEYLFGKLSEASKFFTDLSNGELADVVYKIGEYRNAILGFWDDGVGDTGGGAVFRQTVLNLTDALGTLLKTFLQILPGFEELNNKEEEGTPILEKLGDKLFILSMRIRDFSDRVKKAAHNFNLFMNERVFDDGNGGSMSRIEKLRQIFTNLSSVFGIFAKVSLIAFSAISKAFYTLSPIFDGFLKLLAKITEPLVALRNNTEVFNNIEDSVDNIFTLLEPVAKVLGEIIGFLGEVAGFFASMAIDTVTSNISFFSDILGVFIELLTGKSAQMERGEGVLEKIRKDFEGIKEACKSGVSALTEFFGALLGDIKKLLGLEEEATEGQDDQNGGVFSGLINFFNTNQFVKDAKAWVDQAIIDVGNFVKSIPDRVMKFGANIYDTLRGLFFTEETKYNGSQLETKQILTPLGEWVVKAADDIKKWFKSLPQKIIDGVGKIGSWIDEVFDYWFNGKEAKTESKAAENKANSATDKDSPLMQRFENFIQEVKTSVAAWFEDLPNKIENAFKSIGDFATNLINALDEFLFGKKIVAVKVGKNSKGEKVYTKTFTRYKTGFSKWLDNVIKDVKKFIQKIPEYIKKGIKGAGDLISTVIGALFGKPDDKEVTNKDVEERLEKPFLGINISNILNTIKEIGIEILNQIARIFTGTDDVEANAEWFSNIVAQGIEWIREKASLALHWVLNFLEDIPTKISNFFKGEDENDADRGPIGQAIINFGQTIGKFIVEDLPATVLGFIDGAVDLFGTIWDKLYNAIIGDAEAESEENQNKIEKQLYPDAMAGDPRYHVESSWEKFVKKLGKTISHIWEELPVWIAEGIELAVSAIGSIVDNVGEWLKGFGVAEKTEDAAETTTQEATEGMAKSAEEGEKKEEPRLVTAIKKIGERIKNLFVEIIPKFIQDAWIAISALGSEVYEGISWIFGAEIPEDQKDSIKAKVALAIRNFLVEELPAKIKEIWKSIKSFGVDMYYGISNAFTGKVGTTDRQKAITEIVKNIGSFITDAFNAIKGLFVTDKDDWKKNIKGGDSVYKQVVAAVEDQQKQANDRLNKDAEQPGAWTFAEELKTSLLDALSSIGPSLLTGIAKVFDWLTSIGDIIADILSGKDSVGNQIEKAYGKEKPELVDALKRVGESLKTFFLDTLPKFLGSALMSLVNNASTFFGNFYDGLNNVAKEEGEKSSNELGQTMADSYTESVNTLFDSAENINNETGEDLNKGTNSVFAAIRSFINGISDIATSDAVKTIAVLALITIIVSRLSELFSVAQLAENIGYTVKWAAILVAVGALSTILSAIIDLVKTGTPEQIERAETILDKLGEFVDKLGNLGIVVGIIKLLSTIDDIWGKEDGDQITKNAGSFKERLMGQLGEIFGDLIGSIPSMLTSAISTFGKGIGIAGAVTVAGKAINATIDETISTVTSSLTEMTAGVGSVMDFVSPFIDAMVELNGKLDIAISTASKFGTLYETLFLSFSGLYSNVSGNNVIGHYGNIGADIRDSTEAYTMDLNKQLEAFIGLSSIIDQMVSALKKFEEIEDPLSALNDFDDLLFAEYGEDDPTKIFTSFLVHLMESLNEAYEEVGSYPDNFMYNEKFVNGMGVITDALTAFIEGLKGFDETNVSVLERALDALGKLAAAFNESDATQESLSKVIFGNRTLSKFGLQLKQFGSYIASFYTSVKSLEGFSEDEYVETNRKVASIIELAQGMASATRLLDSLGVSALDEFGQKVASLGHNLGTLFKEFNEMMKKYNIDSERIHLLSDAGLSISSILYSLNAVFGEGNKFDSVIDQFYNQMGEENRYNKLAASLKLFNDAIIESLTNEEQLDKIGESGAAIAIKLHDSIQSAFDADPELRIQITPVIKLDDDTKEQLKQQLSGAGLTFNMAPVAQTVQGANTITDEERVKSAELYQHIDSVKVSVDTLKDSQATVDQITSAFARLNMYINKDILVGEIAPDIDAKIGEYIALLNLGVATP